MFRVCQQCAYFNQCIVVHSIAALVYTQIIDKIEEDAGETLGREGNGT